MPTVALTTLGCKVNQYETQKILESFEGQGFQVVPFDGSADVYVINSCSVTSDAESKSRYVVRRAKRSNPDATVVVTGCAAQTSINKQTEFEGADLVVPNPEKLETAERFLHAFPHLKPALPGTVAQDRFGGRSRATLKIQDGCDVFCSYCSIPFTRPGMVSREAEAVIQEAQQFAEAGYQEIVLTGVLIGAYGPESGSGGPNFEALTRRIAVESGVPRIRISSIEMHHVTDELLDLIEAGHVVKHLHIPLQAGSDRVLKDMNRRYGRQQFIDRCLAIKKRIPGLTITTDILVGFPTEDESCFQETLDLCAEVEFLKAHVFRFSPRYGTKADVWGDPVNPEVKKNRAQRLTQLTDATGQAILQANVGKSLRVVWESKISKDGLLEGLSDEWFTVRAAGSASACRTIGWFESFELVGSTLFGEIRNAPQSASLRMIRA